jgi:hypothetical protein
LNLDREKIYLLLLNVPTGFGVQPAFYLMGIGVLLRGKAAVV